MVAHEKGHAPFLRQFWKEKYNALHIMGVSNACRMERAHVMQCIRLYPCTSWVIFLSRLPVWHVLEGVHNRQSLYYVLTHSQGNLASEVMGEPRTTNEKNLLRPDWNLEVKGSLKQLIRVAWDIKVSLLKRVRSRAESDTGRKYSVITRKMTLMGLYYFVLPHMRTLALRMILPAKFLEIMKAKSKILEK